MSSTIMKKLNPELIKNNSMAKLKKEAAIKQGASLLQQGEVVAFPTETVYGLGADAGSKSAVAKIFAAKGRPQDNPLIVHIGRKNQVKKIIKGSLPEFAEKLINVFWPGPLTLILPKNKNISSKTTAGLSTVGVRMPSHPAARALIQLAQVPVAAPSANSSGYPSPTRAQHVYNDLQGKIPLIIDGGQCEVGVESTVIKIEKNSPVVLRPGGITREEIKSVLKKEVKIQNEIKNNIKSDNIPAAPGMKYRHYSPVTPVKLVSTENLDQINSLIPEFEELKMALLVTSESKNCLSDFSYGNFALTVEDMGSRKNIKEIAYNLFSLLRKLDHQDYDLIIVETIPETGLGEAVMNRLHKAASGFIAPESYD